MQGCRGVKVRLKLEEMTHATARIVRVCLQEPPPRAFGTLRAPLTLNLDRPLEHGVLLEAQQAAELEEDGAEDEEVDLQRV
jgi:hypothetical protein